MKLTIEQAMQKGVNAHKEGEFQEAKRLYQAVLQTHPEHPDANHNLGLLAISENRSAEALPLFARALKVDPKIEQFWLSYINALTRNMQYSGAKNAIKKAKRKGFHGHKFSALSKRLMSLTDGTTPPQTELDRLLLHYQNGRYGDAEKLALLITQEFPKHQFGWRVLGAVLGHTNKNYDALNAMQNAVALSPQDASAHSDMGIALQKLDKSTAAEASYRKALSLTSDFAEAHGNLGITLEKLGRLDEAEASFRHAISLKPDYAGAYNNLGNTLKELGRLKEAESCYKKAITLSPDHTEAHYNLGICLYETNRYDIALKEFELNDTQLSKSYAIRCSFLHDEQSIFDKKLDFLIHLGENNAVIGSLISCSEIKYGVKRLNPFCNEPLKYALKTNLYERYDFEEIFVKTSRNVLRDSSVSRKAQTLLTNGIQTAGNIFAVKKISETKIESIIRAEIQRYRTHFKDSDEGFIINWPTSYKLNGWLVSMQNGGKLASHMHERGWISGSIYINVPEKSETDSGNLVLRLGEHEQEHALQFQNSQESIIDVVTGSLCLFPSSLHHHTVPFEDKENRIVLAFDVVPTE